MFLKISGEAISSPVFKMLRLVQWSFSNPSALHTVFFLILNLDYDVDQ